MNKLEIWVLTRAINDYNQEGNYLITAYDHRPDSVELSKATGMTEEYCENIVNDKGRIDYEDSWYYLTKLNNGELYKIRFN